jgi:hypothetical protein
VSRLEPPVSFALAVIETVAPRFAPPDGAVIETVGAVASTFHVRLAAPLVLPYGSIARTAKVWDASERPV